jgi:hypothetical protein
MQQLESDYASYKVKAQAMLKSQKPNDLKDTDELETLHRVVQDFHSEVAILKSVDCQFYTVLSLIYSIQ